MDKKGFTLIELIIYLGMIILVLSIVTAFLPDLLKTNSYAQKKEEVVDSVERTIELISQEIRHASEIYTATSIFDSNPGQLSLVTEYNLPAGENNTFVDFYLDDGGIYLKKEGDIAQLITPKKIEVTDFVLTHLNTSETIPAIRISLTANYKTSSTELTERTQTSLSTTASLRSY